MIGSICIFVMLVAFLWYAVREHRVMKRRHARRRAAFNKKRFQWRVDDRDNAVEHGKALFASTGDPRYDPENYDSTWEYAAVVRAFFTLDAPVDVIIVARTVVIDGACHRAVMLRTEELLVPSLLCNPDLMQPRVDDVDRPVTCLRCLAKELRHGA